MKKALGGYANTERWL